jgi:hypothetical protein
MLKQVVRIVNIIFSGLLLQDAPGRNGVCYVSPRGDNYKLMASNHASVLFFLSVLVVVLYFSFSLLEICERFYSV